MEKFGKILAFFALLLGFLPFALADPSFIEEYSHVSETSAFVYWQSNESMHSYVEYGTTASFGSQTPTQGNNWLTQQGVSTQHGMYTHAHYVRDLQHNTQYYYRRVMVDKNNNHFYGMTQTFTTQDYGGNKIEVPGSLSGPVYVLNQDNANYVLTQDITTSGGAIQITGSGITFDLDGHTITYNNVHDGTSSGNYGVDLRSSNIKVFNGKIVQGAGNDRAPAGSSVGHNPLYIAPNNIINTEIAGVYMQYSGMQVSGLVHGQNGGTNLHIHHNVLNDLGTGIDGFTGRETMVKSIWLPPYVIPSIDHNLILRTRHTGISYNYGRGGGGDIFSNEIYTDSYATNAFGIYFTGGANGGRVYNNKFFATGYHAVSLALMGGTTNFDIHDNYIEMFATVPNCRWTYESGPLYACPMTSMSGVRVMWAAPQNVDFYDNTIIMHGDNSAGQNSHARALWLYFQPTPLGIDIHDNVLESYGSELSNTCTLWIDGNEYPSGSGTAPVTIHDNIIASNTCHVALGEYYGTGQNSIFENNIFRKLDNEDYYYTMRVGYGNHDSFGHIFRDNVFENGASPRIISWECHGEEGRVPRCNYKVEWTLNVNFVDGSDNPISGASLQVQNALGSPVLSTTTSGTTVSAVLEEFLRDFDGTNYYTETNYAPYTVTVDYSGWHHVEQVALDQTTTLNIVYDPSAPSIANTQCQVNSNWQDCSTVQYGNTISQIRTQCTDPDGVGITSASFELRNAFDNILLLQGSQASSGTPATVTWNNNDYTIVDSGGFQLTAVCTDVQGKTATQTVEWSLPWGTLSSQHSLPVQNPYELSNGQSFTYRTTLTCNGGECGTVSATLDPFDDSGWEEVYREDFNTPATYTDGQTFGTNNWLTAQTSNNGQIIVQNGYATVDTSSGFADMAMIRSTNVLPEFHKVRVKVGFINYDLSNYDSSDYDNPAFNNHQGYYENGVYLVTLTDDACESTECEEQWWHFHRKAVMDVDNHLEWGTGTLVNHPLYMVYFSPEIDTAGGGNKIRSWDGSIWHEEEWNWESAYTYQSNTWYYAEIEKMYNKLILRLYDENQNLITETSPVRDGLVYKLQDAIEYAYFGEPHIDDYRGSARFDEITLLSHDSYSCGTYCQGSNGCTDYNAGPSCSISAAQCDGTNVIDNIYVNVDQRVLPGSQVTVGVDYDCWADQSGGSTDVVSIWYHNGNSWRLIERWTEQAGELTGCDSVAGDTDGTLFTTFTLDSNVGQHTIRAIENDQDVQWPEETSACPQPSTSPQTPYGDFDDLVLTVSPYQSKGVVPVGSGSPFYTTDNNPQQCTNMKGGDSCTTTWNVFVNENSGLYEFFAFYTPLNSNIAGTTSPLRGVNITAQPACPLKYDTQPCNSCIENSELLGAIADWFSNSISIPVLMDTIKAWKAGC